MTGYIMRVSEAVGGVVWGPAGAALLALCGLWLTAKSGAFQFRYMGYCMRHTIGAVFTDGEVTAHAARGDKAISQFQSMCTALAGTLGTGNIVGVASAVTCGGPGAVFWMWVMALLGMATSFAENTLGIYYRRRAPNGEWAGGAMYYLAEGVGARLGRALAVAFALFCTLASFGIGNMSQTNSIAGSLRAAFGVSEWVCGLTLAALTALIVGGGLGRVAAACEKLVPFMALFFTVGALMVVGANIKAVPAALRAILSGAFSLRAAGGGAVGCGMARAVSWGFRRGAFSNEAGLGSAVMVNASANVTEPVQQGMWGVFEVFFDTIVLCTLTALVLLSSGVVDLQTGLAASGAADSALVGQAFGTVFGALGPKYIAIAVLLFAYSTVLGWSHYGAKAFEYLFGAKALWLYRAAFVAASAVGAGIDLDLAWSLADMFNGLMMLPNIFALFALSGTVARISQNYVARHMRGEHIAPLLSAYQQPGGGNILQNF